MEIYALEPIFAQRYLNTLENATNDDRNMALDRFGEEEPVGILSQDGNSATITISGVTSPNGPSPLARYFGFSGTAYKDIVNAANQLKNDSSVEDVRLVMNTPGGTVEGVDSARQALAELAKVKNVVAENHGMIASAGYYMASAVPKITAVSDFAKTGSIGVIIAGLDNTEAMAERGYKKVRIVSKNAPDKAPDISTDHGVEVLQREVDATERVFIRAVAEGRDKTDQYVIDNFGKGAMLIAEDPDGSKPSALSVGLIDSVDSSGVANSDELGYNSEELQNEPSGADGGHQTRRSKMDVDTLKLEHPATYAAVLSAGTTQERERVEAHMEMGDASGDMKMALEHIKSGSGFTAAINAKYMAAGMKNNAIAARTDEAPEDMDTSNEDADTLDDQLSSKLADITGVE